MLAGTNPRTLATSCQVSLATMESNGCPGPKGTYGVRRERTASLSSTAQLLYFVIFYFVSPVLDLYATVDQTTLRSRAVVTYPCDEGTTDGGAFDGNAILSATCPDALSFPVSQQRIFFLCCHHCLQSCGCCHHFQDGVRLGHGNDFFDGCHGNGCSKTASQVDWWAYWFRGTGTCSCVSGSLQS